MMPDSNTLCDERARIEKRERECNYHVHTLMLVLNSVAILTPSRTILAKKSHILIFILRPSQTEHKRSPSDSVTNEPIGLIAKDVLQNKSDITGILAKKCSKANLLETNLDILTLYSTLYKWVGTFNEREELYRASLQCKAALKIWPHESGVLSPEAVLASSSTFLLYVCR